MAPLIHIPVDAARLLAPRHLRNADLGARSITVALLLAFLQASIGADYFTSSLGQSVTSCVEAAGKVEERDVGTGQPESRTMALAETGS